MLQVDQIKVVKETAGDDLMLVGPFFVSLTLLAGVREVLSNSED